MGTRVLGLVGMMSLLACDSSGNAPGEQTEAVHAPLKMHKVQLTAEQAKQLEQQGADVQTVADYGSFKVVELFDRGMAALPEGAQTRDDYNEILLNAGVIDTKSALGQSLRGMTAQSSGKRLHLVQFAGPVKPEWVQELEATGVKIVTYIPNNAYIVYGDAASLSSLEQHIAATPSIQWNGEYLNDYKLDPSLQTIQTKAYSIQLVKDEEANGPTLDLIRAKQSRNGTIREALGYVNVVAYVTVQDLYELATRPDVLSIQPRSEPRLFDERQDMIISGNVTGNLPSGPGYLAWLAGKGFTQAQFTASGFGVDLSDSGFDNGTTQPNHFGFYTGGNISNPSRIAYARFEGTGTSLQGCDGHGNLNAHIVGGYTNQSGAPFQDGEGYSFGLGVAPFVKLGSSVIFGPDWTDPIYEDLQSRAYRDGMRISSNSWGFTSGNSYNIDCQQYDALVRDAQPAIAAVPVAGNQEMVIVFAAGNSGSAANTVAPPATAKNVISVGASENVQAFGGADGCGTTDAEANSINDIASFSSRGPSSDGRKKPDIVAPGTHVSGGVAQDPAQRANPPAFPNGKALSCFDATGVCAGNGSDFFPSTQQWYTASSGTSHSTPAVAGGAALVRQYFINQGFTPPSAAMTKAYLMNSARYMTGSAANDNLWSNNQGMGLMDLGMAFDGIPRKLDDQNPANLFTATGQTRTFTGIVADNSKPLRITLGWTDAPGATTGSAWKNDLDLTVTLGANTYKGNVFTGANSVTGGTADTKNNVESVFLPAGTTGTFTVTVTASNINSDGVPGNASSIDQDFALLAYNSCETIGQVPTGVSAAINGPNRIDVSWTENGAASYSVLRSTTAGGPYTKVGSVTASPFVDTNVSRDITYYYVVRSAQCAESGNSTEVSATATGVCKLPPTFAGVSSVGNNQAATCATAVNWAAGAPICGGTLSYSVYRGTSATFTPSIANKIATGLTGTSFTDDLNLANGTRYYYVVRATETSDAVNEESNTVTKSAAPTGARFANDYLDDLDGNRPANASAYWIPTTQTGTNGTMNITSGCHYQSATSSYHFGAAATTCGGTYPLNTQATLVLGGDGTTPGINGFNVPPSRTQQMKFNLWYELESRYDGAWLVYSTTSANGPWTSVGDTTSTTAPYISAGGYDNTLNSNAAQRIWTSTNQGGNGALKAVTVNLAPLAGQQVWFGFRFYSDNTVVKEGMYIDNVSVTSDAFAACTTNTPPPGPAVAYKLTNLPATVRAGDPATFDITAMDAVGLTATGYTGTASITSSDPQAQLPAGATFTAGVAAGVPASFRTTGKQTITASDTANPATTGSASTTVTAGDPTSLFLLAQPSNATAGVSITPPVTVGMKDQFGNVVSTGSNPITVALANNAGGGTLSGTTTVAALNGVASFGDLSLNKVGTGYTLDISSPGLTGLTSAGFNITPAAPAKLAFLTQPVTAKAGDAITPAVQVIILDQFDNTTDSTADVNVILNNNRNGAVLSGSTTVTAVNGVATFTDLSINKVNTGYTLDAASASLANTTSDPFDITPADPYRVIITGQPSDAVAGAAISPAVQATVLDRFDNVATQATDPVSAALGNNPTGAKLRGTTAVNPVSGVATFSDLSVSKPGLSYTLVLGSRQLYTATSVAFDTTSRPQGNADKLVFRPSADHIGAGEATTIEVELQDADGRLLADATDSVTLSLGENPAGGQLLGATTVAAVNGVATFTGLSVRKAGGGYALLANAQGYDSATSAAFSVTPGPAASFVVTLPASVTAGEEVSVSATALDAYGNVASSYAGSVNVASTDASAAFTTTATFVNGALGNFKVTFKSTGLKSLTFTDAANSTVTSSARTNVTAFGQPSAAVTNPAGGTKVSGTVDITATGTVALGTTLTKLAIFVDGTELSSGTASTLTGHWDSTQAEAGSHIITATVTDGAGNTTTSAAVIVFSAVVPGPAASFALTLPASVTAGEEITLSATALDAHGNVASSYAGTVNVTSTDSSASFSTTATFVDGALGSFKVTFKSPGLKTLTFTDASNASLAGSARSNVTAFGQPTAAVTDPVGGSVVSGKVNITATGAVAAGTTLTKLAILVDGAEIASGTDATVTGSWDSTKAQAGTHLITAVVTDGAGSTVTSAPVIVSTEEGGCGCGATSGTDASIYLGLLALARYALGRRRKAA